MTYVKPKADTAAYIIARIATLICVSDVLVKIFNAKSYKYVMYISIMLLYVLFFFFLSISSQTLIFQYCM